MKKVLNVGAGNRLNPMPPLYRDWQQLWLDINPESRPDVLGDARQLIHARPAEYDAVYCAHNLEHYYQHEAIVVLRGFVHVLRDEGFAHLRVPDLGELMRIVVQQNLDIDDVLYPSLAGPITVRDVLYGYGPEIERTGNDFYAHKTGFTQKSLTGLLLASGFASVFAGAGNLEVYAFAFKRQPTPELVSLLQLTPAPG
jgi:hypothetical protein